ncbi:MAG: hypothetical protein HYV60_12810, partial [Planctomycetia bacterium]|nr:hypothetical protein [Planctomycetia bacterium]
MNDESWRSHERHLSDELLIRLVQEVSAGTEAVPDLLPPDVLEHFFAGESNAEDRQFLEQLFRENPGLAELVSDLMSVTEHVDDEMPAVRLPILVAAALVETEDKVDIDTQWNRAVAELAKYPKWPRLPRRSNMTGATALAASLLLLLGFGIGTQWPTSSPSDPSGGVIISSGLQPPGVVFNVDR